MRFLRGLVDTAAKKKTRPQIVTLTTTPTRAFAHVHDIQIKWVRSGGLEQDHDQTPTPNPSSKLDPRHNHHGQDEQVRSSMSRNVFKQPLSLHSTRPMTGYMRTGYCEAPKSDAGNHSVAAIVSNEFLDFSAARGNDLRTVGLTDGCKWCLCVSRWKEAFDARTGLEDKKVPRIVLKATHERALEGVAMEDLKKFAVDGE